jgi:protein-S-isoprenylcysteine O-methyltransferase Ste14
VKAIRLSKENDIGICSAIFEFKSFDTFPKKVASLCGGFLMNWVEIACVIMAIVFQRQVYSQTKQNLEDRQHAKYKNHFFNTVYYASYFLIFASIGLHVLNPFFNETPLQNAVRFILGLVALIGGGAILNSGKQTLGDSYSDCKDSFIPGKLRTEGIYGYIRHPIYTGNLTMAVGIACLLPGIASFVLIALLTFSYRLAVLREERDLVENFPEYSRYLKSTGAFFPVIKVMSYRTSESYSTQMEVKSKSNEINAA